MKLLDLVAQTAAPRTFRDKHGRSMRYSAVADAAADLKECPIRYVLDRAASAQCNDLVISAPELFDASDSFLRLPSDNFWLEWFGDPEEGSTQIFGRDRMGALVRADEGGRRGEIRLFWPDSVGVGCTSGAVIFDLDHPIKVPEKSQHRFRMSHRDLPHIDALLRHTALEMDPEWVEFMSHWTADDRASYLSWLASSAWFGIPVLLSFSAILNSGGLLDSRNSDLARLNKSRTASRKAPLLEHVEVSMRLGLSHASGFVSSGLGERRTPRLHYVRGHLVRRSGKTFWRASHLRGDPSAPLLSRTVRFSGANHAKKQVST